VIFIDLSICTNKQVIDFSTFVVVIILMKCNIRLIKQNAICKVQSIDVIIKHSLYTTNVTKLRYKIELTTINSETQEIICYIHMSVLWLYRTT